MMEKLTAEARRILHKRIKSAIHTARYYPAKMIDHDKAADDVLKAFDVKDSYGIYDAAKGETVFIP